jgi:hypothetical protein
MIDLPLVPAIRILFCTGRGGVVDEYIAVVSYASGHGFTECDWVGG